MYANTDQNPEQCKMYEAYEVPAAKADIKCIETRIHMETKQLILAQEVKQKKSD